jgi:hypothetical protein
MKNVELLLTAVDIAKCLKYIMSAQTGERYALVAFVGSRPLRWIERPKGLKLYCWPSAGGTHPDGVDSLLEAEAEVAFVEHLHSKVYHSDYGTIVGSPNLSANAMGGVLTETAVFLPPGVFSIQKQLARIAGGVCTSGSKEFSTRLARLRLEHNAFRQRNQQSTPGGQSDVSTVVEVGAKKRQSFGDWFSAKNRPAWQFAPWSYTAEIPDDVEAEQHETTGKSAATWISSERQDKFALHMPTLDCKLLKNSDGVYKNGMRWWFPDAVFSTSNGEWSEAPYIFLAQTLIPHGCTVPFSLDEKFHYALSAAVRELGGEWGKMIEAVTDDFVASIARHYFAQSEIQSLRL